MSETEFLDLAPGDPVSQDGSLRAFRYSQFSACPSAPFNTAEPEYLPSQFHLSASLETSSLLELEDHNCLPEAGLLGGISSSLLCSSSKSDALSEGEKCNSVCDEHLQPGASFSDSLGLSLFDAYVGFKKCQSSPWRVRCDLGMLEEETQVSDVGASISAQQDLHVHSPIQDSPRRIYCDPRLLEEETQVSDDGVLVSNQQTSRLLPPRQHLQSASQAFDCGCVAAVLLKEENKSILSTDAEPGKGLPLLAVKPESHAVEIFDDTCQTWHSRRSSPDTTAVPSTSAAIGLSFETKMDRIKPSTSNALDSDQYRGHPTGVEPVNAVPCAAKQMTSAGAAATASIVLKCHNRRKITLSATTDINSLAHIGLPFEAKREVIRPSTSGADHFGDQPTDIGPENAIPSTATNENISAAVDNNDYEDIVQRWHNRNRVALSAITNLSSSSAGAPFKKLKHTPEKVVESGTSHSGQFQSLLLKDPLFDKENSSLPQYGRDRTCEETIARRCGSETTEEDVNDNDDTDDSCYSKFHRKRHFSCARGIKRFLLLATAQNEPSIGTSSTSESVVSKPECAGKKWTCPRKYRPKGRQRTIDAWIK